jgi:hypothetical protein
MPDADIDRVQEYVAGLMRREPGYVLTRDVDAPRPEVVESIKTLLLGTFGRGTRSLYPGVDVRDQKVIVSISLRKVGAGGGTLYSNIRLRINAEHGLFRYVVEARAPSGAVRHLRSSHLPDLTTLIGARDRDYMRTHLFDYFDYMEATTPAIDTDPISLMDKRGDP